VQSFGGHVWERVGLGRRGPLLSTFHLGAAIPARQPNPEDL